MQYAAVEHHHVSDQNVITDDGWQPLAIAPRRIDMNDGAVLNVAARADADTVHVAAQDAVIPDA
jgi:hypothetical protein